MLFFSGPGGAFAIDCPSSIDNWMGETNLPIMSIPDSIIPLTFNEVHLPTKPIVETSNFQHGFIYEHAKIILMNIHVLDVMCTGNYCNALGMFPGGKALKSCPCFQRSKRDSDMSFLFDLEIIVADGFTFHVRYHTDKAFTRFFVKGGSLPIGITASHFSSSRREMAKLRTTVNDLIKYIDGGGDTTAVEGEDRGGFTVHGWVRRGNINDQSVDTPTGPGSRNEVRRTVQASDLTYHLTSIIPTSPNLLDDLEDKRFDVSPLLNGTNTHVIV